MKLQPTTKPQPNGFSLVEMMVAASISSILLSASFAGLASMAKLQAKSQLRADATEALSLAKIDFRDGLPVNTTTAPDCASEVLHQDATRGWAHLETICVRGSLEVTTDGFAFREVTPAT